MSDVEIITDGGRRRRWSAAGKLRISRVRRRPNLDERASILVVARRTGVAPSLLHRGRRLMLEGGSVAVTGDDEGTGRKLVRQREERVRELARRLGREALEVEILKEALDEARPKDPTWLVRPPLRDGGR